MRGLEGRPHGADGEYVRVKSGQCSRCGAGTAGVTWRQERYPQRATCAFRRTQRHCRWEGNGQDLSVSMWHAKPSPYALRPMGIQESARQPTRFRPGRSGAPPEGAQRSESRHNAPCHRSLLGSVRTGVRGIIEQAQPLPQEDVCPCRARARCRSPPRSSFRLPACRRMRLRCGSALPRRVQLLLGGRVAATESDARTQGVPESTHAPQR